MQVTPALRRLRHKDLEFKVSLGYIARSCLVEEKKKSVVSRRRGEGQIEGTQGIFRATKLYCMIL
jgi:hypothetical protein